MSRGTVNMPAIRGRLQAGGNDNITAQSKLRCQSASAIALNQGYKSYKTPVGQKVDKTNDERQTRY